MSAPSDAELRQGLEAALAAMGHELTGRIERRPSPYRTSFPIEELTVELAGRGRMRLGCKRLDREELSAQAQLAKPRCLWDPEREPAVYHSLLPQAPPGAPELFGTVSESGRHWLFVEWVDGRELFQVGERELWERAARWLGSFHAALAPEAESHREQGRLLCHNAGFYRGWIERAERFATERGDGSAAAIASLRERHSEVVEALLEQPRTVLHGEFYASNVLIAPDLGQSSREAKTDARVAPVDWELAAIGPGLTDLAALVSGWPAAGREAITAAYASEPGVPTFSPRDLDLARLQVAIQWLGWAPPKWRPPEEQRHDWLAEALELAERSGL